MSTQLERENQRGTSDPPDRTDALKIEITRQMVLAGKAALERHFPNSSEELLVAEVYRAMEMSRIGHHSHQSS
jgi:hypothetical protein